LTVVAHISPTTSNRIPPHSIEAERATLGSVLIKPSSLDEISDLKVNDFFLPAHREIYEAMLDLDRRRRPIEIVELAEELKARNMLGRLDGGETYLLTLANAVTIGDQARHFAGIVAKKAQQRRLIQACAELSSSAYGDVYDPLELLAEARQKITQIEADGQGGGPVKIGEHLQATLASIESRAQNPGGYFVKTGIRAFDEEIGGLRGGNLIVIATRPGMGKSAWLLDILLHGASTGVPSLLFSMEMNEEEIHERTLAKHASVNGRKIVAGKLSADDWARVDASAAQIVNMPIWLDTRYLSAQRICSEARRWRAQLKAKRAIIAIDYLGLVQSSDKDERNRAQELGAMTRAFKQLAGELNDPVFLLAQLNRENVKAGRKPQVSDLRDSGAIEQDANTVIFPWWEGTPPAFSAKDDEPRRHPAMLIVGKNRGGPTGEVEVDWIPEFIRFEDTIENQDRQRSLT